MSVAVAEADLVELPAVDQLRAHVVEGGSPASPLDPLEEMRRGLVESFRAGDVARCIQLALMLRLMLVTVRLELSRAQVRDLRQKLIRGGKRRRVLPPADELDAAISKAQEQLRKMGKRPTLAGAREVVAGNYHVDPESVRKALQRGADPEESSWDDVI
ncbi:MAG: hypothetical protein MUC34_19890 [Anaerolineae bacterium]|nr:hypothetical protein [Anaerolineae bacterium]